MLSRRKFLTGVSLLPLISSRVEAFYHRSVASVPMSRVQVGTPNPDGSAFKNFMSSLGSWRTTTANYAYPTQLNSDQYPFGTLAGQIVGAVGLPSNITSSDVLVVAWTGTISTSGMQIAVNSPGVTVTAGSGFVNGSTTFNLNLNGTNGYIEFNFVSPKAGTNYGVVFQRGATFTGFSGLIYCRKSYYASIVAATRAQQLLSSAYVSAFTALAPKSIRSMAWTNPNNSNNFSQHRYRHKWQTALSFGITRWAPTCWAGGAGTAGPNITSGGGGNAFVAAAATDTPSAYTNGEVLQGQVDAAGTGTNLTINVGGRGAVPLFSISGGALTAGSISANALCTLVYDDIQGGYIYSGSAPTSGGAGMTANIPVESQIGLANAVGCALWYTFPPHITFKNSTMEGGSNSVTQIASLINSTLIGGFYNEYANEVWNNASGFPQTAWMAAVGTLLGIGSGQPTGDYSYYSYRIIQHARLINALWTEPYHFLKHVCAFQAVDSTSNVRNNRLNSVTLAPSGTHTGTGNALWNSYTGSADYTQSPNRCVDVVDTLAYATYYAGAQCTNGFAAGYAANMPGTGITTGGPASGPGSAISGLTGAADTYALGGATNIANALAWLNWDFNQGTNNGTGGGATLAILASTYYPRWETVAASYDSKRPSGKSPLTIEHYEGALEAAAPTIAQCTRMGIATTYAAEISHLLTAYKQSSTFFATVQTQFNQFFASGPHAATACWFTMTGGTQWSMYEPPGDVYSATWQSYPAVAAYHYP